MSHKLNVKTSALKLATKSRAHVPTMHEGLLPGLHCAVSRFDSRRSRSDAGLVSSRVDSSALGPDVIEDESSDEEAQQNFNNTIADVSEIGIRRVTLKDAVEESECDLQAGITDPVASGRDPAREERH